MNKNMQLIKSEQFGQVKCDFWKDEKDAIVMTREQIGQAMEYAEPNIAIHKIHERNKDRLDKFSTLVKLVNVEGNRTVTREVIVYNAKGIYEICRFSRQPKADAFMDWVWDVIETIRKTGSYSMNNGKLTNAQRIRVIDIISKCNEYRLPYVLEIAKPFFTNDYLDKFATSNINQTVSQFLKSHIVLGLPTNKAYFDYIKFCNQENLTSVSHISFSKQVKKILSIKIWNKKMCGKKYRIFNQY